jgi:hypothetical protein
VTSGILLHPLLSKIMLRWSEPMRGARGKIRKYEHPTGADNNCQKALYEKQPPDVIIKIRMTDTRLNMSVTNLHAA